MAEFATGTGGVFPGVLFTLAAGFDHGALEFVQPFDDNPRTVELGGTLETNTNNKPSAGGTYFGEEIDKSAASFDWFEDFHVVPRVFDFGNLLSDQSLPIEVFSAFRKDQKTWDTFTNNAGAGISLGSAPSLPSAFGVLSGTKGMTLDASTSGPPFVDSTADFFFSGVGTATITITLQRIVLWEHLPEGRYNEVLRFFTDVSESKDGSERRQAPRKFPRVSLVHQYLIDHGEPSARAENQLFDFQALTFGVPNWRDGTTATVAIAANDTVLTVESTAYRDFRDGGLVLVFTDEDTFDALPIVSTTATTITVGSPVVNNYAIGTQVLPLNACYAPSTIGAGRYAVNIDVFELEWLIADSEVDLGDLTPFDSYNSKLLLTQNVLRGGPVGLKFSHLFFELDGQVGAINREETWGRHKRTSQFTIRAEGRQGIFELRGLLYALRGRQTSFYIARAADDLTPTQDLTSGSMALTVANVGYAQFVRERQPKQVLRVNFADGSPALFRTVTDSTVIDATEESLDLNTTWPATYTPADISRIEYVEEVRFASDDIVIEYDQAGYVARVTAELVAVFE